MSYLLGLYDWSLYTLPAALPMSNVEGDTHPNDPNGPTYSSDAPSWIGETFTFNGGTPTQIEINDDDGDFEDGYVETGGPQTLAQPVTIGGTTYPAGSVVENEFSMLDSAGNEIWVVRIDGVNVGFSYPAGAEPDPGDAFIPASGRDGDPADSTDGVGSAEPYRAMVCFTPGTLIATTDGATPVESLTLGARVLTASGAARPIRWLSRRRVHFDSVTDTAKPVRIAAGAFGRGVPHRALAVSPQHRFVFRHHDAPHRPRVLVPARALTLLPGIREMRSSRQIDYLHFALDRHRIIHAEGVLTESCYLGPMALRSMPPQDRRRLRSLFPALNVTTGRGYGPLAHPALRVGEARRLVRKGALSPARPAALAPAGHLLESGALGA